MAGSLSHLVDEHGAFRFGLIENMGDAHEACEECFDIIALLVCEVEVAVGASGMPFDARKLMEQVCGYANAPVPEAIPVFGAREA